MEFEMLGLVPEGKSGKLLTGVAADADKTTKLSHVIFPSQHVAATFANLY
jgi:hypothetical protein